MFIFILVSQKYIDHTDVSVSLWSSLYSYFASCHAHFVLFNNGFASVCGSLKYLCVYHLDHFNYSEGLQGTQSNPVIHRNTRTVLHQDDYLLSPCFIQPQNAYKRWT